MTTVQFIQNIQRFPSGDAVLRVAEKAFHNEDLRTLRLVVRDLDAGTIGLTPSEREGLEAVLKSEVGIDMDGEQEAKRQRVASIVRRGRIAGEKERKRLEDYVELLEAHGGDPGEIDAVKRLLRSS